MPLFKGEKSSMNTGDWVMLKETLGLSWDGLADALGLSVRHVYRYRDQKLPTPRKVQLAAEGLICRIVHQKLPTNGGRRGQ